MTEEEMQTLITENNKKLSDLEAERDSLKKENEELKKKAAEDAAELKKTKELNFTLSRTFESKPRRSAEAVLNDIFK